MTSQQSTWTGMVPVDDTALYVRDTGGPGHPMVYLNGAYADQSHWRRVIADLGSDYRHITYDERARGKSKRSADYSFEGAVRDLATGTSHRSRFTSERPSSDPPGPAWSQ
jgi:pimeloyl-ACP methyl ester carboxylesterase